VPQDEVEDTNLTFEVGVKFLVSGGILVPENLRSRPYNPANDGTFEESATIHEPSAEELVEAELEHARREAAKELAAAAAAQEQASGALPSPGAKSSGAKSSSGASEGKKKKP
jgi:hypothetical protein